VLEFRVVRQRGGELRSAAREMISTQNRTAVNK
jgi:hypothetical protein